MNKSEQINELAAALARAQGQMASAKKDSDNPFFKSKYADLASVVEAIRGPFAEHGLSYVQLPIPTEGNVITIETVLMHASGQWISSVVDVPVAKADAQGYGSAITYARRYGLQAMAGVAAEDDDGNAAAKAKPRPTEAEMMPTPKAPASNLHPVMEDALRGIAPPRAPEMQEHPNRISFKLKGANYSTAGMTAAQMLQSFDLVPVVDKRYGKDYCREVLKTEFGAVSRSDLTEEQAAQYLARLVELKEAE